MSGKRLFIDLDKLNRHSEWQVRCSYSGHPRNNGTAFIRETATYALICRRCEEGTCVLACVGAPHLPLGVAVQRVQVDE